MVTGPSRSLRALAMPSLRRCTLTLMACFLLSLSIRDWLSSSCYRVRVLDVTDVLKSDLPAFRVASLSSLQAKF